MYLTYANVNPGWIHNKWCPFCVQSVKKVSEFVCCIAALNMFWQKNSRKSLFLPGWFKRLCRPSWQKLFSPIMIWVWLPWRVGKRQGIDSAWNWSQCDLSLLIENTGWYAPVYTIQPVVKPGCTTVLTTGCIHDTAGCQTGCQTGLTTGWIFVYTIQPVVKPVWQFWQPVGNRLYRVNGAIGLHP